MTGAAADLAPAGAAAGGEAIGSVGGVRRVARNGVALLLAYILPRLFTLVAIVAAARVLGAARFGMYGTAGAFAVILSVVATAGIMPLLIRDLAREPWRAPQLLQAAHVVKTGTNLLMLVLLYVLADRVLAFPPTVVAAALLLGLAYAIGAYVENLAAFFQATERMRVWAEASAALGMVTGLLGAAIVVSTRSVVWFCVAPIAGQVAALAWLTWRMPASARAAVPVARADVARLARAALPFAAAFLALTVYSKADVLLLARWRPESDVGLYTAAYRFVDLTQALAIIAVSAVYPRLSRLSPPAGSNGRWAGTRVAELALLGAVPCAATLWILRGWLVHALFGGEYTAASPALGALAAALPMLVLNILGGYLLSTADRMRSMALLYGGGIVVSVTLNALLIGPLGPLGAGLAKLTAETLLALGFLAVLRRGAAAVPSRRVLALTGAAAALAPIASILPIPGGDPATAASYLIAVAGLFAWADALDSRERRLLRSALGSAAKP